MLEYLHLKGVGPSPDLKLDLAPRLNVVTGDNGLGKSFLLDVAWWALTRTWPGYPALPYSGGSAASIGFKVQGKVRDREYVSTYDARAQDWRGSAGRPVNPGLVLYAQVDGGFGVWDPARNYWRKIGNRDVQDRPPNYLFKPSNVWDGIKGSSGMVCNGLIRDWVTWQLEDGRTFKLLRAALRAMSPSAEDALKPGTPRRISLDDVRDFPTVAMPYGQDVPVVHASAGMRRIIALVYLLVWAWEEHRKASELLGQAPSSQVIFLIDEIEAHLHPQWQRRVMASLLAVVSEILAGARADVQILAATHSPLVLASLEPIFDEDKDALWHFGLDRQQVKLDQVPWVRQGDAANWLVHEAFGLRQARSAEAERAIEAAEAFMRDDFDALPSDLRTRDGIDAELRRLLAGHDAFWPRWIVGAQTASPKTPSRPRRPSRKKITRGDGR